MRVPLRISKLATAIALGAALMSAATLLRAAPAAADEAASTAARSTPSDTGLFAPVAMQYAWHLAEIGKLEGAPTPELANLLLGCGRFDEAAALGGRMRGDARAVARAEVRIRLARADYAGATPLMPRIIALGAAHDPERSLHHAWAFLHDDAAQVDRMTRSIALAPGTEARVSDLLAAGKLAYDRLDEARADSCFTRALERTAQPFGDPEREAFRRSEHAEALVGLGKIAARRRDYDLALERHRAAIELSVTAESLRWLGDALIRLGRTDEAITANEWAVRIHPYHEAAHYTLGNGYARKNYTQLAVAFPQGFADAGGRAGFARADSLLAAGQRPRARALYEQIGRAHPEWADASVRLASLEFEDGRFDRARDLCFAALERCPEYGRAHATLAKALESRRFAIDVHRPDYERRFRAAPMPPVPGIETFVSNWKSLSPRHQKRVALSVAPWKQFIPVLVEGGATYYIKPLSMLLSETPGQGTLRDQRISYDSRLWDDVRGAGGYHTVTGIEDVERTIFDRYNTVLHELTHQVHAVLTADQRREIQELYVRAKARDDSTRNAFLSRYAGGSVHEYFAEGANALYSPRRDAYDAREEVRERLDAMDPDLRESVKRFVALPDVSPSYPVAFSNAGDDRLERGEVDAAIGWYEKALARSPNEETALRSWTSALILGGRKAEALAAAERAWQAHPASGDVVATTADALWYGGRGLEAAIARLERGRAAVPRQDRASVDLSLAHARWVKGDAAGSLAACDSVLAYQGDHPQGLWAHAAALALAGRSTEAFETYQKAVRLRTGVVELRCDYARDLLRAGRIDAAQVQLAEAKLLDEENATAEALRGWAELAAGRFDAAAGHLERARAWGPWSDLAAIVSGGLDQRRGDPVAAEARWRPVRERIAANLPPGYVYRPALAKWEPVHELPAVERELLKSFEGGKARVAR